MKDLPVYKISIDESLSDGEHLGMQQIAYTATPAIIAKGVAFSDKPLKRKFSDALKLRVAAPVMIPDMHIYRRDDELGEYYVVFTAEMIERIVKDFAKQKYTNVFNIEHNANEQVDSSIIESWFVEFPETDKSVTVYGLDPLPVGSYFAVSQFWNAEYFQKEIIEKDRTGYSIEGFLGMEFKRIEQKIKTQKNKMKEQIKTADGRILFIEDNKIVEIKQAEEEKVPEEKKEDEVPAEEKMAEAPAVEEEVPAAEAPAKEEEPVKEDMSALIKATVEPMFSDFIKQLAELKTLVENASAPKAAPAEMKKEKYDAVSNCAAFLRAR